MARSEIKYADRSGAEYFLGEKSIFYIPHLVAGYDGAFAVADLMVEFANKMLERQNENEEGN